MRSLINALVFCASLFSSLFVAAPVAAQDDLLDMDTSADYWEGYTGMYEPGMSTQFTGVIDDMPGQASTSQGGFGVPSSRGHNNATMAAAAFSAYEGCEANPLYTGRCRVSLLGWSDSIEYSNPGLHKEYNASISQARLQEITGPLCRKFGNSLCAVVLQSKAAMSTDLGWRYVYGKVYVTNERGSRDRRDREPPKPKSACSDGEDNDGDGLIDLADPGCSESKDNSEWNYDEAELWRTAIEIDRVFRDYSDKKCPWRIVASNREGLITVDVTKTDPDCDCDDEKAFRTEMSYEEALSAEIGHKPLRPTDQSREVVFNHYSSMRSVFTDDIGATWDEALFYTYGQVTVTKSRNECEAVRVGGYGSGGLVGGSIEAGGTFVPADGPFNPGVGPDAAAHVQVGAVLGGGRAAVVLGVGVGAAWDPNCLMPGHADFEAIVGPWLNRQGRVGFTALLKGSYGLTIYNNELTGNRYRLSGQLGLPIQLDRKLKAESQIYLMPYVGIGTDWVSGEVKETGNFVTTERQGLVVGVSVLKVGF